MNPSYAETPYGPRGTDRQVRQRTGPPLCPNCRRAWLKPERAMMTTSIRGENFMVEMIVDVCQWDGCRFQRLTDPQKLERRRLAIAMYQRAHALPETGTLEIDELGRGKGPDEMYLSLIEEIRRSGAELTEKQRATLSSAKSKIFLNESAGDALSEAEARKIEAIYAYACRG